MPWHFWSKINKNQNPSSLPGDGAGMKIREYDPQTSPCPVNIPPIHLYAPHNQFAKETQGSNSSPARLLIGLFSVLIIYLPFLEGFLLSYRVFFST